MARQGVICLLSSSTDFQPSSVTALAHTLFRPLVQLFILMPCGCRFHNETVPTGRHTQTCVLSNMMRHYYNSWGDETTHTLSCQKRGGEMQTKLVREQKQYLIDRYCVSAFTQIINWNIKREMRAINAVIGHRKGNLMIFTTYWSFYRWLLNCPSEIKRENESMTKRRALMHKKSTVVVPWYSNCIWEMVIVWYLY